MTGMGWQTCGWRVSSDSQPNWDTIATRRVRRDDTSEEMKAKHTLRKTLLGACVFRIITTSLGVLDHAEQSSALSDVVRRQRLPFCDVAPIRSEVQPLAACAKHWCS